MSNIIIFAGTTEGRTLAEALQGASLQLHLCVATEYGAALLPKAENITVHTGRLEPEEMERLFLESGAELVLDATHPYAIVVTENVEAVCRKCSLPLIRVCRGAEREQSPAESQEVVFVDSVEEAAEYLRTVEGKILITTGSKELDKYTVIEDYQNRCVARVLPTLSVMEKCSGLGFAGKNLIAMQGPFTEELNYWMLKQTGCKLLVTKASGKEGGYGEKCEAALRAGAKLVVIKRPCEKNGSDAKKMTAEEALAYLAERFALKLPSCSRGRQEQQPDAAASRTAYLIGMGPGSLELLTGEAKRYLQECDCIIGAERMVEACLQIADKPCFKSYKKEEIAAFLREHEEYRRAALVYSGDIGFYSGAKGMEKALTGFRVVSATGISSAQYFLNKIGAGWQDVELASCHGKRGNLIPLLLKRGRVFSLLGGGEDVSDICDSLLELGLENTELTVGERLSYPEERIVTGKPEALRGQRFAALSVLYLERKGVGGQEKGFSAPEGGTLRAWKHSLPGLPDEAFLRDKVPMTKQGIRILSLAKLGLTEDAVVYDIGAGTGSVSVEAALLCPKGEVYAIERKPEAAELIRRNRVRFQAANLIVVEGTAPEALKDLPAPTHAFVGGSGGNLMEIIEAVRSRNPAVRFAVNAVTLETIAQLQRIPLCFPEYGDMELLQANLSVGRAVGRYHMMSAENPVMIASFGGKAHNPEQGQEE